MSMRTKVLDDMRDKVQAISSEAIMGVHRGESGADEISEYLRLLAHERLAD